MQRDGSLKYVQGIDYNQLILIKQTVPNVCSSPTSPWRGTGFEELRESLK